MKYVKILLHTLSEKNHKAKHKELSSLEK